MEQREACFARATWLWLTVNYISASVTSGEWVRCSLHGQVSLAASNQIYVIHEAMNGFSLLITYAILNAHADVSSETRSNFYLGLLRV